MENQLPNQTDRDRDSCREYFSPRFEQLGPGGIAAGIETSHLGIKSNYRLFALLNSKNKAFSFNRNEENEG